MVNSVLQKRFKIIALTGLCLLLFGFRTEPDVRQMLSWSNRILNQVYDQSGDVKLKKLELNVTDNYFLRLRKTYQNGKQEYFSCHLSSFGELTYFGTTESGLIHINTRGEDVIVQTYGDRKGNVDSMATTLTIPVKNIQVEQLDSLRNAFLTFKTATEVH